MVEQFGRADIIDYLSSKPSFYNDAWRDRWLKLALRLFPEGDTAKYGKIVSKFFKAPLKKLGISGTPLCDLVSYYFCQDEDVKVYHIDYPVLLVQFPMSWDKRALGKTYCVIGREDSRLTAQDVVKILISCWLSPKEEASDYHKDRPRGAKELLIARLQLLVDEEVGRAGYNFDRACAVGPNGKKITIADRVIVVKEDGSLPIFDADLFVKNKIERPENMGRIDAWVAKDILRAVNMVRCGKHDGVYASANGLGKWSDDFIIHEKFIFSLPSNSGTVVRDIL